MPKVVDHEMRRREILDALLRITARGGLGAATFREIAAEAGVSVRLVQYYFGTKADLLHAANRRVAERATPRIVQRVRRLGPDAPPDKIVRTVVRSFLPRDDASRETMLLFYAFFTEQMTNPALARGEAADIAGSISTLVANQIRRAQDAGTASSDLDPELEAWFLVGALPNIAAGVIVHYLTLRQADKILTYAIDRIFGSR
jgi:AcrR family transcriptional regulator